MKKALILGASGGLGREIARALIEDGYEVIGTYKSKRGENSKVKWLSLDIDNEESLEEFLKSISREKIDFFTSTIARTRTLGKFENLSEEVFKGELETNLIRHITIAKKISKLMNEESNIIFILTRLLDGSEKNMSPYIISKYALLGLMKSLSAEWKERRIRVNAISPGMMDTKFAWTVDFGKGAGEIPRALKEREINNKVMITPGMVAKKIIEIIKDEKINGENLFLT